MTKDLKLDCSICGILLGDYPKSSDVHMVVALCASCAANYSISLNKRKGY